MPKTYSTIIDLCLRHPEDEEWMFVGSMGTKIWFRGNRFHNMSGPARIFADGTKFWYIDGERIDVSSQEEFERLLELKAFW
jgi:hypothetical protein